MTTNTYLRTSEGSEDNSKGVVEFSEDDDAAKQRLKDKVRQMMAKAVGQALVKSVRTRSFSAPSAFICCL